MGALDIAAKALKSKKVRKAIASGGKRIIKKPEADALGDKNQNGIAAVIGKIWDVAKGLVGWITSKIKGLFNFNASKAFGQFVNAASFIWNFNWQATDKELYENIEQNFVAIAGQVGSLAGSSVGYLAGGIIPSATVFVFNQAAGAKAMAAVSEEARDELAGQFSNLIQMTCQNLLQAQLTYGFINLRKWIKGNINGEYPQMDAALKGILGKNYTKVIQDWGKEGNEPWSFSKAWEDYVESIDNKYLKAFVENAFESFTESFVEAGFVFANAWDSRKMEQKAIARQVLGPDRTVQIIPDRKADDQVIVLSGKENTIRPLISQTMANYHLLGNRDVGAIYGLPMAEQARRMPSNLSMTVVYSSTPPGREIPANTPKKRHEINIYGLEKSKLDWETLKKAVGKDGHTFGRWSTIAQLSTNEKLVVYTDDPSEGQEFINELKILCKGEIQGMTQNEELKVGQRVPGKPLYKEAIKVYPLYATIMNSQKVLADEKAKGSLRGSYLTNTQKIELWMDDEPSYFSELITELFKMPGADDNT